MIKYLLVLTISFIFLNISNAYALEASIKNTTFFSQDKLDRFYFNENGKFFQQLANDIGDIPKGTLLKGIWTFDDNRSELCLDYTQPNYNITCFFFVENNGGYTLVDNKNVTHFIWNNNRKGNWLLSQDGMNTLKNTFETQPINSNETDLKITDYLIDTIFKVDDDNFLYVMTTHKGLIYDIENQGTIPFKWNIENLHTTLFDNNDDIIYKGVVTLGDEFLEDKPEKIYFYLNRDSFAIEGEGDFTLTPLNDHPQKDVFLNYLSDSAAAE